MAPLRDALTAAGLTRVETHLQSGNVIADHDDRERFAWVLREVIAEVFGLDVAVIVRSGHELAEVLAWNPFPEAAERTPKLVHVSFLAEAPDPERLRDLEELSTGADEWEIRGREIVVSYDATSRDSTLGRGLGRLLGSGTTARNWTTVKALARMAAPQP